MGSDSSAGVSWASIVRESETAFRVYKKPQVKKQEKVWKVTALSGDVENVHVKDVSESEEEIVVESIVAVS
ncbi:hypothetical protein LINPERHAP1_LOCUS12922 [Linum perenne]